MPMTGNVAWDGRLADFKGSDTARYIEMVTATANRCAACRPRFGPGADLSLTVDITEGCDSGGAPCRAFKPAVCHLQCQEPKLKVHQATHCIGDDLASVGARLVLDYGGPGQANIPVLAYTLVPSLVIGEPGGEMTSAMVSALLSPDFQMSLSDSYGEIAQQACLVQDTCTVDSGGAVELLVDGEPMYSQQLDQTDPGDALWLEGARAGHLLVISGYNLVFRDAGLELSAAPGHARRRSRPGALTTEPARSPSVISG